MTVAFGMFSIPFFDDIYGKADSFFILFHRTHAKCGEIAPRDCGQRAQIHNHGAHRSPLNAISPLSKVKLNATNATEELMSNSTNPTPRR